MRELFLLANIAGRMVALRSDEVESVVDIADVRPVPRAAPQVRGLAALRSRVVTVIDTGMALGEPATDAQRRAVVTQFDGHHYALLVDGLNDVSEFDALPLPSGSTFGPRWVGVANGVIDRDGELVLILDLAAVLARITGEAREVA